ncbi:hypothetical protein VSAK1_21424 [Vibrio mediterranei AK1]|uniref:hypothetical protein n=1 Tax=Vibrio mediterranei TaxID=689 RepID=UPI0001541CBA|nr:hypothetical protein [Vibrio mediterranei]EDL54103.1 hypothetical protein VSAK1_21424 [Vibrio mediterranei AK1]
MIKVKAIYQKAALQAVSVMSIPFGILYYEKRELYLLIIAVFLSIGLFQAHVLSLAKRNLVYLGRLISILIVTFIFGWMVSPSVVAIPSSLMMGWLSWNGLKELEANN